MFHNREDAARQLAARLKERDLHAPLVLGIPGGGVILGAVLAQELVADLDIILVRKLHAPEEPELAIGAVAETGAVYLDPPMAQLTGVSGRYLDAECRRQIAEINRRLRLYRAVLPEADVTGRSVIVVDDGLATGATMIAALLAVRGQDPHELIAAVPVAASERLRDVRRWCDDLVYLEAPRDFWAVSQVYDDFPQVPDDQVVKVLRQFAPGSLAGLTGPEADRGDSFRPGPEQTPGRQP